MDFRVDLSTSFVSTSKSIGEAEHTSVENQTDGRWRYDNLDLRFLVCIGAAAVYQQLKIRYISKGKTLLQ